MNYTEIKMLVDKGLSTRLIAKEKNCSQSNVKYWLHKYNLRTLHAEKPKLSKEERIKKRNADTVVRVSNRRRKIKLLAVEYKGGKCQICGYDKFVGALEFHHTNGEKDFGISASGTTRSWEKIKKELDKCILVCANCHAEIHGNVAELVSSN